LTLNYAEQIAEFEIKNRLPSMNEQGHFAVAGGLMSYSESLPAMWYRAAVFVDKILKGAKPTDLTIEPPPKFDFVINLKTAEKIGVTIPPEILLEANEVIR
jgi:putative ABC transport system substrate-binding protein